MATLLAHSNAVDAATLSGGSWNATYPLNNLKTRYLTQAARTTNAAEASTIIILDLGATKSIGCLGLVRTNLTANATIQIQANTSNAWTTPLLDILPFKVYAAGGDYFQHFGNSAYRYWRVLISDTANAAGFVSIGRLFLGPLFVPTIPNDFNPTLQIESQSQAVMSLGGQEYFESRPNRRVWKFNWSWLPDADVYNTLIPLQLNNDIGGEVIVFCDSPNPNPLPLFSSAMAFDNAYWTKTSGAVTANSLLAPDGTWTADSFIETAASAQHYLGRLINAGTPGVALIVSVYAKAIGSRYLQIYSQHAGNVYANFDIQTGTLGTKASAVTSFIEPAANGFYRCYMVVASLTTANANAGFVCATSTSHAFAAGYTGDGTSGLVLWGAEAWTSNLPSPVYDVIPDAATRGLLTFLGRFRTLDPIAHPYVNQNTLGVEVGELL